MQLNNARVEKKHIQKQQQAQQNKEEELKTTDDHRMLQLTTQDAE